ncbi:carbohydrate-binding module family 12 protein [Mycena floridula]|nr:carbohydrate-binding module family 12 protein [Mycena floridula]
MTQYWEPGTQYNTGDIVEFEGHRYKIIQPHRSQSDWTPNITPALWGRLSDGSSNHGSEHHGGQHYGSENRHEQHEQPYQQPPVQNEQPVQISHEERKTHWYDLDDKRKKELEVGGGLLAGIAAIGAGYAAYRHHEKSEEEKKAQVWALSNWLHEAQQRADDFYRNGLRGPAQWVLTEGKNIPAEAIVVGQEKSWTLYICRAFHEGSLQIGKASPAFEKGAVIGYGHDEIHFDKYEILVGNMQGLRWEEIHGRLNVNNLGYRPVDGGHEADGTILYIAEAEYHGAVHPGKASEKWDVAFIPYDGDEKEVKPYKVLCYA